MEEKSCYNCGYCKEHLAYDYCQCKERNILNGDCFIDNDNEANTCQFYDDDSWMK